MVSSRMAAELRETALPPSLLLPRTVRDTPFVLRVLEALTTTGCRDSIDHERCAKRLPVRSAAYAPHGMLRVALAWVSCILALKIYCSF